MFNSRKNDPGKLIQKYFQQLTSGCGRPNCTNKECVSGGRIALSNNEAGALALHFLLQNAQICDVFGMLHCFINRDNIFNVSFV